MNTTVSFCGKFAAWLLIAIVTMAGIGLLILAFKFVLFAVGL